MKKLKIVLTLILLIIALFGMNKFVYAESGTNNITLSASSSTVNVGENVTVTLKTAQQIEAADFTINYSSDILEFVSTSINEDHYNSTNAGTIKVCTYDTSGIDTFTFTFKVNDGGTANITTDIEVLYIDQTEENILSFSNESLNIISRDDIKYIKNPHFAIQYDTNINMLSGIDEKVIISNLISTENFSNNYTVKVYKKGNEITSGYTGTGTVIKIFDGTNEVKEYTSIIYGDTTGDGLITSVDALTIVKNKLGLENFKSEVYKEAGRVTISTRTDKTTPSAIDALACIKYKLGTGTISQY